MSNGEIFVVDRQSETFLEPPDFEDGNKVTNAMSFGRVPAFGVVDSSDGLVLAVSESGDGTLHRTSIVQTALSTRRGGHEALGKQQGDKTVEVHELERFTCKNASEMKRLGATNQVFSASLQTKLGFFVVAQRDGTVSFYRIAGCQLVAYLNQPQWDRDFGRQITKGGGLALSLASDFDGRPAGHQPLTAKN